MKISRKSSSTSYCLDPWPTWLMKEPIHLIVPLITNIVNKSMLEGKVAAFLKKAILTPLMKKSGLDLESLKNYHTTSNLSFVSNVIERVIAVHIIEHLLTHDMHKTM